MLLRKHPNMAYMTYSMSHVYIPYAGSDRKYLDDVSAISNLFTPLKTNMDTPHDGLEKVVPFKYGHYWYLC